MVEAFAARPAYPMGLIDALAELCSETGLVAEVGAGLGHVALPLAERGLNVVAIEPALAMLEGLREAARARGVAVAAVHATAEQLPLANGSVEALIVSDALHFMDVVLAAAEFARVLVPGGALAVVPCELAPTPFMRAVEVVMRDSAPRRPRNTAPAVIQVSRLLKAPYGPPRHFEDATAVDSQALERILRSISFIGPAMNELRFARFLERIHALSDEPVWARRFTLHAGRRAR